jgi:hypothetical protein
MIAQLKMINLNAKMTAKSGKTFSGVEVTYQAQPTAKYGEKPPTTRFLFNDNPVARGLQNMKSGDWVEIKFDNDQFKTPLSIETITDPSSSPSTASSPKSGGSTWGKKDEGTEKRIARAVAIKEATQLVLAMVTAGSFPKTKAAQKEFLAQQVLEVAVQYEPYLTLSEQSDDLEKPEMGDDDFEQEGFED